jgi:small subunit ribosomal protein S21
MSKFERSIRGNSVEVKNDDVNKALRKFKKKVQDSGLFQDLQRKEYFEKPTTKRKRKKAAAKNRWQKKLRDQQLPPKNY